LIVLSLPSIEALISQLPGNGSQHRATKTKNHRGPQWRLSEKRNLFEFLASSFSRLVEAHEKVAGYVKVRSEIVL